MDLERALALFDADVRVDPAAAPGTQARRSGPLVLLTGGFNYVSWWELSADTAPAAVRNCAAHFRARGEDLLWRVWTFRTTFRPSWLTKALSRILPEL